MAGARIPRFYIDQSLDTDSELRLSRQQTHHLVQVLRLGPKSPVVLFNNQGGEYSCEIVGVERSGTVIRIHDFRQDDLESGLLVHLGVVLSKGSRMDQILQKATELGTRQISLLSSDHCVVKLDPRRIDAKLRHWRGIVASACEQCGRNRFPELLAPLPFDEFIVSCNEDRKLLLDPGGSRLARGSHHPQSLVVVSGPEGGFSQAESDRALQRGFAAISLGPRILRAETAPLTAISLVQHLWGDI